MEAFEHVVKVYLETEGYIVTSGIKFPVEVELRQRDGKIQRQRHGFEVDLVAAKSRSLLLGSVKSFFGSTGVQRSGFTGLTAEDKPALLGRYRMFNDAHVRRGIIEGAKERYGYSSKEIELALFVGKFKKGDEEPIREHLSKIKAGGGPVRVVALDEMVDRLLELSASPPTSMTRLWSR